MNSELTSVTQIIRAGYKNTTRHHHVVELIYWYIFFWNVAPDATLFPVVFLFIFYCFQILKGVQDRAVPVVPPAQVYAAQTVYVLSLAFSQPAAETTHPKKRRHVQLQPRRVLHEVRRDDRHLPRWRRVSAPPSCSAWTRHAAADNFTAVGCLQMYEKFKTNQTVNQS